VQQIVKRNLKGIAGVHLVTAELSLKGFVALPTTRNLKSFDIVACLPDLSRFVLIQVKSTDKPKSGWPVYTIPKGSNKSWQKELKERVFIGANFFYIFVELPNGKNLNPSFYIVPSKDVANMLVKNMKEYLGYNKKLKAGGQHLAWGYGGLQPTMTKKYQNRWELLFPRGEV
jgi:hypothetical protein